MRAPFYLLEIDGELHMAARFIDNDEEVMPLEFFHCRYTEAVIIYKWDTATSNWEMVETLADYSLFIVSNTSFAVLASQHPKCKPACIYFTDDFVQSGIYLNGRDIGIYNFDTEEKELFDVADDDLFCRFSAPVWFTPRLL
ncbi:hypothetical protein ACHQM5_001549 [Ranunculus cassubicifolius]